MIRNLFYIILLVLLTVNNSIAQRDPFTRSLTRENISKNQDEEIIQDKTIFAEKPTETFLRKRSSNPNILNVDPILDEDLDKYILKGTALSPLSKISEKSFIKKERQGLNKIDLGNIPTVHVIQSGDSLESIAKEYGFTVAELKIANGVISSRDTLIVGNYLTLPNRYHLVKKGETLNSIAKVYNIDAGQLAAFNNLKEKENILLREKLQLPFFIFYNNKPQSLNDIAKQFDRTVAELKTINQFSKTDIINKDQIVKIPIYVNVARDYQNLNVKSIHDYKINSNNMAIVAVDNKQFMVNEGSRLGNKKGIIVSIQKNMMIVLENSNEFIFEINTPINPRKIAMTNNSKQKTDEDKIEDKMEDNSGNDRNSTPNTNKELINK
jgi:LysM repeat protein